MAYTPVSSALEHCSHCRHCEEHDLRKMMEKIEALTSIKMNIIRGGPSIADPAATINWHIGMRDKHGNAFHLIVNYNDVLQLYPVERKV